MKYLVIGAGGTGGPLGAYLANAGKDVTFLARGAHLDAMREQGFRVIRPAGDIRLFPVSVKRGDVPRRAGCDIRLCKGVFPAGNHTVCPANRP